MPFQFQNTYQQIDKRLFSISKPTPVKESKLIIFNEVLAQSHGLNSMENMAELLSGNSILDNTQPIALAYAGHQFGHFNILGDGRAHLLGEHTLPSGERFDIQLKGSGPSPYSRRGDGRATVSAMLREYLISEAMYHLGIPTTRSLAVVATGEKVYRDPIQDGAVLTRVAASHIRVGTFEYARYLNDKEMLQQLTSYTINRHYPELIHADNLALALLEKVMQQQISLIVNWMRVGFIHGVMNTDNMSIAGETIDYGPCAFMNNYDPNTVFSSIDANGRYAFANQPHIAQWNIASLASSLLPIIDDQEENAIAKAQEIIYSFPALYEKAYLEMMCNKLGILHKKEEDKILVDTLLHWMALHKVDYTNTFLKIQGEVFITDIIFENEIFQNWLSTYHQRIAAQEKVATYEVMQKNNPVFIPRNHIVENALQAATNDDLAPFHQLLQIIEKPYQYDDLFANNLKGQNDEYYKTFCGT